LRVEVDLAARKAYLYQGNKRVETHRVAVGSPKWPTQTGQWTIKQVVFNPEWIPPDESWAEEREPRKPGDPKNPLGMAQLVYDPPRSIHGTDAPSSIGTATSHGSIRMRNEEIVALAKRLLAATGAAKDAAWYQRAATQRSVKQIVDLPTPVPITVH
ncbi:MAG: ErfK/YbiS/YcfS/YnhG family protein, partial [Gemmatimonadetes bacterium]|nr:ErfK/YbiS/YcfS/YnhG family protein [Gemmatimonadota bacterium]